MVNRAYEEPSEFELELVENPEAETGDDSSGGGFSRRNLIIGGAAAGLMVAAAAGVEAQLQPMQASSTMLRFWRDPDLRLLRRVTYGVLDAEVRELKGIGYQAWLEQQLNPETIDDSACETLCQQRWPRYFFEANQMVDEDSSGWYLWLDTMSTMTHRAVFSKRQLHERMEEFWRDHFTMDDGKVDYGMLALFYRKAVRPHVLGKFSDLLKSAVRTGSMMRYLDNVDNTAGNMNVNFAREILELYTVGVDAGYTEQDIREVAKIFTGWSADMVWNSPTHRQYIYRANRHTPGSKTVMGRVFTDAGENEGIALMDWLAMLPATADFIGAKLTRWFLGIDPWPQLQSQIRNTWASSGGDLKAVLRVILARANMSRIQPKFKRPFHLGVSLWRQVGAAAPSTYLGLNRFILEPTNHTFFGWKQPNGYPDTFTYWGQSMRERVHFALLYSNWGVWGLVVDTRGFYGKEWPSGIEAVNSVRSKLFNNELNFADHQWLIRFARSKPMSDAHRRQIIGLALASPSFQWF